MIYHELQGGTYPALMAMTSRWIPEPEKTTLSGIIWAGSQVGAVCSMAVSGILAKETGWESIFFLFGFLTVMWFIFWSYFCFSCPHDHPRISKDEKRYLELFGNKVRPPDSWSKLPPFKSILTSVPFLAMTLAHFGNSVGLYMLVTEIPTFLNNILHFPIELVLINSISNNMHGSSLRSLSCR